VRLFCDEMLASLARWLRAAGHDTALAPPGTPDAAVLDRCADDRRLLLSRDRALVQAAAGRCAALLLPEGSLDDHARALRDTIGLYWGHAPFTRCMADNEPLQPAGPDDVERTPAPFRQSPRDVRSCPACGRVYWPGGHVARMAARLEGWRTRGTAPAG